MLNYNRFYTLLVLVPQTILYKVLSGLNSVKQKLVKVIFIVSFNNVVADFIDNTFYNIKRLFTSKVVDSIIFVITIVLRFALLVISL